LTPEECNMVKLLGEKRVKRSTVRFKDGTIGPDPSRTSKTGNFERSETQLIGEIERKATSLFNFPSSFVERIQILKYEPSQQYLPHYDSYRDSDLAVGSENRERFEKGYQRIISLFVYLSDSPPCDKHLSEILFKNDGSYDDNGIPVIGKFENPLCSSTHFTNLNFSFNGCVGDALLWTNTDSTKRTIPQSLHQGSPLCEGSPEKWALNIWIHSKSVLNEEI
jgi:hypothetical protein